MFVKIFFDNFYLLMSYHTYIFFLICMLLQVPADGLLIKGHSLAIDESSMTGESKIVSWLDLLAKWKFNY